MRCLSRRNDGVCWRSWKQRMAGFSRMRCSPQGHLLLFSEMSRIDNVSHVVSGYSIDQRLEDFSMGSVVRTALW